MPVVDVRAGRLLAAEYRAWVIVTSSRAARMLISRSSRRTIASPSAAGVIAAATLEKGGAVKAPE